MKKDLKKRFKMVGFGVFLILFGIIWFANDFFGWGVPMAPILTFLIGIKIIQMNL